MPASGRRRTARRRRKALGRTIVLSLVLGVIGAGLPFEPYDWAQQWVTARLNTKAYDGRAIIVAVDASTLEKLQRPALNHDDLARLVERLNAAGVERILIDRLPEGDNSPAATIRLAEALARAPVKPAMFIDLVPRSAQAANRGEAAVRASDDATFTAKPIDPLLRPHIVAANWVGSGNPVGAPLSLPHSLRGDDTVYPSLSHLLAKRTEPDFRAGQIDLSYDPSSVPAISAIDVLDGTADIALLRGRPVLIGSTADAVRDSMRTAQGRFVPRAAMVIIAGQTLIDGPPRLIGWIPSFLIAVMAAFAWVYLPPPRGRILAVLSFAAILISPLLLERVLVFQNTSNAVFLLVLIGMSRVWGNFRQSLAMSRQAAETKSWFLAQASHDLRQPIHAIGLLAARLGQTDLAPAQAELVAKIDRSVDAASRMFQSLLDIATIESGTLKPVVVPVSVNELFAEIDGQNALAAERAGVDIRFVPSRLVLCADRALVITMLQNIVSNAIKYASGKAVLIGARRQGGTVALCVYDRGEGIAASHLSQVTKAFYRVMDRGSGPADGAGLGLAIVHRLAELMGLKFRLRSAPGRGTAAIISGFRTTDEMPRSQTVAHHAVPQPLTGLRVLLADDDQDSLRAAESLLMQWGCAVVAHSAFPPVPEPCDVIISDFDFGHGHTLADHRATIAALAERLVPTIVVSGHHPDAVRAAMQQERLLVLSKPLRPAELRAVLMSTKAARAAV